MSVQPLDGMPESLQAGLTWLIRFAISQYPAGDWTGHLYLVGEAGTFDQACTADGDAHLLEVLPADSEDIAAGIYSWSLRVSMAGQVFEAAKGSVAVTPNLAEADASDQRSHARKTLALIEAVIEGKATADMQEYEIQGRKVRSYTWEELIKVRDQYRSLVKSEELKDRRASGKMGSSIVRPRFIK